MDNPFANNGGKRRHHRAPALDADQLQKVRSLNGKISRGGLAKMFKVHRNTIYMAINHLGAYETR